MGHVMRMALTGTVGFLFVFAVDAMNLYWLSRSGDTMLVAAAGFAFAIQVISVAAAISMMIAATALISRSIGAGEAARARRQTTSAAIIAAVLQLLLAIVLLSFRHKILAVLGATGEAAEHAARYLLISLPTLTILGAAMVINGAIRAEGDARRSVAVTMAGGVMSLMLDPILIFVLDWGLEGAAIGIGVARTASFLLAVRIARKVHDLLDRPSRADIRETLRPFVGIAGPALLTQLARPTGTAVLVMAMAPFGEEAMAGWSVLTRLIMVAFGGLFALAAAIGGIFGQNLGARRFDRLRSTFRDAIIFGLIYVLIVWGLLYLATEPVIRMFDLTGDGAEVIRAFTHFGAAGFLFSVGLFVTNAAFNALGKAPWATAINWLREGLLTFPIATLMAASFGAVGIVYSQFVVSAIIGIIAGLFGLWFIRTLNAGNAPATPASPTFAE
ncbi:MAG: multidrug transporter MATE [Rhodobacteraceae bacterium]|nr:multidrug transporter MATE [Paracoccaceae bacterium]